MTCFNLKNRKKAYVEIDTTRDLQSLHDNFPKVSKAWKVIRFHSFLKLRRNLMTSDKVCSAIQEVIVHENKDKKNYELSLSTLEIIVTCKNENSEI